MINTKPRWLLVTDAIEATALIESGKWREDKPTTVRRGPLLWVEVNEQFNRWRETFRTGKNLVSL